MIPKSMQSVKGFTLIEMAIVLIIISLIAGTAFILFSTQQLTSQNNVNVNNLNVIQTAINVYVNQNNALPCPAATNAALNSTTFGVATDCTTSTAPSGTTDTAITGATTYGIRYGAVPTRTLNLPDNYMFDGWNRRINYAVVKQMAVPATQTINFSNFASNFPASASDTIRINDSSGNRINQVNSSTGSNYVTYVLIAHGPAGNGATRYEGTTGISCPTATGILDKENCNGDIIFMDSYYNTSASAYYDNTVRWKTYTQQLFDAGFASNIVSGSSGASSGSGALYGLFTYTLTSGSLAASQQNFVNNLYQWITRPINTIKVNNLTSATLSNNTITLGAGQYVIRAVVASYNLGYNKIRIYNTTTGALLGTGTINPNADVGGYPEASAYLDISTSNTIRIDQMHQNQNPTDGYGQGYVTGDSLSYDFLQVHIWQIG